MIKLVGIAIVAIGFVLRVNALLIVVAAMIVTGLVAGFSFHDILRQIGQYFVDNRFLMLPVLLMLPVVGVLERHGLQDHIAALMRRTRAATAGRVLWTYQLVRELTSMIGLSLGNHASMVRPLVAPMAVAASSPRAGAASEGVEKDGFAVGRVIPNAPLRTCAPRTAAASGQAALPPAESFDALSAPTSPAEPTARSATVDSAQAQSIRAHAAAAENVGNFFADDLVVAVGALLLIKGFFDSVGVEVSLADLKRWSLPTALWVLAIGWWRYRALDRRLQRARGERGSADASP